MEKVKSPVHSFSVVTWVFIILLIVFNWGALGWEDAIQLILNREEEFIRNVLHTLPLNLSLAFALILGTSVKEYRTWHLNLSLLFFIGITSLFNIQGWLNPPIAFNSNPPMLVKGWILMRNYFEHYGFFNFLSSILIALYFTYVWHFEILGKRKEDFD